MERSASVCVSSRAREVCLCSRFLYNLKNILTLTVRYHIILIFIAVVNINNLDNYLNNKKL